MTIWHKTACVPPRYRFTRKCLNSRVTLGTADVLLIISRLDLGLVTFALRHFYAERDQHTVGLVIVRVYPDVVTVFVNGINVCTCIK